MCTGHQRKWPFIIVIVIVIVITANLMSKRVCIDLNGVLDTYSGWQGEVTWHPPRAGAQAFLQALRARGFEIVVLTVRRPEDARRWLESHGLAAYVSDVTDRKPPAFVYIDDRALCFRGAFDDTLRQMERFQPHWHGDRQDCNGAAEPGQPAEQGQPGEPGEQGTST